MAGQTAAVPKTKAVPMSHQLSNLSQPLQPPSSLLQQSQFLPSLAQHQPQVQPLSNSQTSASTSASITQSQSSLHSDSRSPSINSSIFDNSFLNASPNDRKDMNRQNTPSATTSVMSTTASSKKPVAVSLIL